MLVLEYIDKLYKIQDSIVDYSFNEYSDRITVLIHMRDKITGRPKILFEFYVKDFNIYDSNDIYLGEVDCLNEDFKGDIHRELKKIKSLGENNGRI
jgi:hypothetical protein